MDIFYNHPVEMMLITVLVILAVKVIEGLIVDKEREDIDEEYEA